MSCILYFENIHLRIYKKNNCWPCKYYQKLWSHDNSAWMHSCPMFDAGIESTHDDHGQCGFTTWRTVNVGIETFDMLYVLCQWEHYGCQGRFYVGVTLITLVFTESYGGSLIYLNNYWQIQVEIGEWCMRRRVLHFGSNKLESSSSKQGKPTSEFTGRPDYVCCRSIPECMFLHNTPALL